MKKNINSETPLERTLGTKIRNNREMSNPALKLKIESRRPAAKPEILWPRKSVTPSITAITIIVTIIIRSIITLALGVG